MVLSILGVLLRLLAKELKHMDTAMEDLVVWIEVLARLFVYSFMIAWALVLFVMK